MTRRAPPPRTVLAVASVGVFIAFVDATIVNIAFPDIVRSFPDASIAGLSWVLNAYNVVFAAFLVPAGRIADLLGRRRTFVLGLWVFTGASVLCAAAPSPGTLVAARVVQALGAALLVPASLSLVLETFPEERRRHAVALWTAVAALAAGIGPSLGGLLITASSWRLVFLVNLPIGIAAVLLARRHLVESRAPGRRRVPDLLGAMLSALAIATLVLGIVQGQAWGWSDPRILGAFAAAVVFGAVVRRRCRTHPEPIVDLGLLRIRAFSLANGMGVIAAAGYFGYTLTNVLHLTAVWGYSAVEAGLALTPGPFVAAAVAGPTSRLTERIGHRPVLLAGGLLWGGAVLWLITQVGPRPAFVSEWLPGMVLLGLGAGTLFPNLSATAVAAAPGERFGTATGLNSVARQIGAALGVAAVIAIIGVPETPAAGLAAFDDAWAFCAACLVVAGAGCLGVGRLPGGGEPPSLGSAMRVALAEPAHGPAPAPDVERRVTADAAPLPEAPLRAESPADFLAGVPLFAGLAPALRAALAAGARPVALGADEWLFAAGEAADAMYVVRAGRLEVVGGDGELMRVLGRGDAVGELALLAGAPRSASVRAARDSDLVALDRTGFERLLRDGPALPLALTRILSGQLRASAGTVRRARPRPGTVALVALDDEVPLRDLAERLGAAIGRSTSHAGLDGSEVQPAPGGADPLAAYGPLLDRAEAAHDLVLLIGGSAGGGDPWTRFCLQQADRVLAVGSGAAGPGAGRPELRGADLVAYGVAPGSGGVAGWAAALDPAGTHAWRAGGRLDEDLRRTARRLTGGAIGVVLSGGGARALTHLGVLEELLAAGIEPDRVLGVGMGALIGAMLAAGMDPGEMDARLYEEWVRRRPLGDYGVPRHALARGERLAGMLERTFGSLAIEELGRAFASASADLRSGDLVVARHGRLASALSATLRLPILLPPAVGEDGRLLVDGSLVDGLPVGTLADAGEGPVIALDAGASPGSAETVPGLTETLTRVLWLAGSATADAARRRADLVIAPDAGGIGLLEFHQLDRAREAGRAAARAALAALPPEILSASRR